MVAKIEKYGANWCQPCKVLDKTLEQITGVEIVKYDVDEIENDKGIRNIPVLIYYDEKGNELARTVGAISLQTILDTLNKY